MSVEMVNTWDPVDYYGVERWSDNYFSINSLGNVCAEPHGRESSTNIDLFEIVQEALSQGVEFPAVIRFHDILRTQVSKINQAFLAAINNCAYRGTYCGVFPIKVNQMREVVEEIVDAGARFNYGLEAGSKAELLAVLAYNSNAGSLTILNGYKDRDYMRLALLGVQMGHRCVIVIENFSEIRTLLEVSREMGVRPLIGLRAKLSSKSRGKWAASSGDNAKFGLTIPEILQSVKLLQVECFDDCLKLFHFHIGSQVTDIRVFKDAITEAARIYCKLSKMDLPLEYFDVGGGLGIDYDGSRSKNDSSKNYHTSEYAADIVQSLQQICDEENVPHPHIVSESGRAVTAHHSCVITNVVDVIKNFKEDLPTDICDNEHQILYNMRQTEKNLNAKNFQEMYHDAQAYREECTNAFKLGILELEERAKTETIYWHILEKINKLSKSANFIPQELEELDNRLAEKYLCNFSVFQSAADVWAIDQVLPIMPISRLNEEATQNCELVDITCDSDGKIKHFTHTSSSNNNSIKLHQLKENEPYYLGIFLTGAYQDVMGDMHNLFGRLNEIHVFSDPEDKSGFYIEEIIHGWNSDKILETMQYNPSSMAANIKKNIDAQIKKGLLTPRKGVKLIDFYEHCLKSTSYLKNDF